MKSDKPVVSLQIKIITLVWAVVALSLLVTSYMITEKITDIVRERISKNAMSVARVVSRAPSVVKALNENNFAEMEDLAQVLSESTNLEIAIFNLKGMKASPVHITQSRQPFVKDDERTASQGQEFISIYEGTYGYSLRAFSPIYSGQGQQVGFVAVGVLLDVVEEAVDQSKFIIYLANTLGLLIGIGGAIMLARSIKKTLFGLEPIEIAKLLEERDAMLQSVKEGVVAVNKDGNITLLNAEAVRLLQLSDAEGEPTGQSVDDWVPNTRLREVLATGQALLDQEQDINGVAVLANQVPVIVHGEIVGAIATFRDKTEFKQLAEELTGVRAYVEAMRSQAHEFMNKLHVILGMVRMECYDQLATYINAIAHGHQTEVNYVSSRIRDPVMAGFILGKLSRARELGVKFSLSSDSSLSHIQDSEFIHEMVTIVGNLIDNAFEAVANTSVKNIVLRLIYQLDWLKIEVSDSGTGIKEECKEQIFIQGYSTKAENRGLGLALVQTSIQRLNGRIELFSEVGKGTKFTVYLPFQGKVNEND